MTLSPSLVLVWQVTPQYTDSADTLSTKIYLRAHASFATVTIDYTFPSLGDASSRRISPDITSCLYPFVFSKRSPDIGLASATTRHLTDTCIQRHYDISLFLASAAGSPTHLLLSKRRTFQSTFLYKYLRFSTTNVFKTIAISFCLFTTASSYKRHCA